MAIHNATIASIFEEIADLLDIQGANPFRVRAYRNASRTIGELGTDVKTLLERGTALTDIPGIGEDLARKIDEILRTGKCDFLERLRKEVPPAITELLKIPGLGPKRVKALWHDLNIQTLEQLMRAAKDGRIRALPGFGDKTEQHILEAAQAHLSQARRFKLAVAAQYAEAFAGYLRRVKGVEEVVIAGSFRRMRETVGDIDILVAAEEGSGVMDRFTAYEEVRDVLASGPTRGSVVLKSGIQVDVRVIPRQSWGAALVYFTGSKAHNIAIRRIAQDKGLKLNEYGVFKGDKPVAGADEISVYKSIGLPWIPPELREDRGEVEAAQAGKLPKLVELADLQGDLHVHSKASDGHNTIREMAQAAQAAGLQYIAMTEHSRRLTVAHGLDPARLAKQGAEIDRLNRELEGITVLKGIEVDILEDGTLDLPDSALAGLDIVVAAVHSKFDLPRAKQTQRILMALDNPAVSILAHPTGRLIEERDPYDVDMQRIIRKAKARNVALEVNAHPERLDLLDIHCQMAKQEGVLVSINSDAHSTYEFGMLGYGVGQARRGWLEKRDVLNTKSLKDLRRWLSERRS
ncbi:MAG TPA: DNA polymerase/3'-5' exonuclease PolX [Burkholderiales bacterium]|nr:DNA polymerase/3'-5' exonuclease PolX [Burkholderiales bacterium]